MLNISSLSLTFNEHGRKIELFNNLNFTLPSTGLVYLKGRSGCGKTTLLKIIYGEKLPYTGQVIFDGQSVFSTKYKNKDVFYLKSEDNLFEYLTLKENVKLFISRLDKNVLEKYLINLGLDIYLDKKINTLSGGEKQRASLLIAFLKRPKMLLLDEAIANIDIKYTAYVLDEIKKISEESLVIVTSHNDSFTMNSNIIIEIDKDVNIKKVSDVVGNVTNKNVANSYSLFNDFIYFYNRNRTMFLIFNIILLVLSLAFSFGVNKYNLTNPDIIYSKYGDVSVNIVLDNEKQYDCLTKRNIYMSKDNYVFDKKLYSNNHTTYVDNYSVACFDDFKFSKIDTLLDDEIVISDKIANALNLHIGDSYTFTNSTYIVKHIYETDFLSKIEDGVFYNTIYLNKNSLNEFYSNILSGKSMFHLDNNDYVQLNNEIDELEFEIDIGSFIVMFNNGDVPEDNLENFYGQNYVLDFTYNGKTITKELKLTYVIPSFYNNQHLFKVSKSLFEELMQEFEINSLSDCVKSQYAYSFENKSDFYKYCNDVYDKNVFVNNHVFDKYYHEQEMFNSYFLSYATINVILFVVMISIYALYILKFELINLRKLKYANYSNRLILLYCGIHLIFIIIIYIIVFLLFNKIIMSNLLLS